MKKEEEEEGKAFTHRLIHQEATKLSQILNRKKRSAVLFSPAQKNRESKFSRRDNKMNRIKASISEPPLNIRESQPACVFINSHQSRPP
jgi:hypothetical protein